ncbi:MAG: hypothetical protein JRG71_08020 [Deltaproteobacteria bacterium]|nr:hypothetical protein [Deltaproteobacteria bacterium]
MKKLSRYLLFCCTIIIAYLMGSMNAQWQETSISQPVQSQNKVFEQRVEHYQPSCQQLSHLGRSPLVQQGNDLFFVYTTKDYFYVVGMNLSPQNDPLTHWWGGERSNAISRHCQE